MSRNRQDSWTDEEDRLLADTVLNYIQTGKTQLDAFQEVGRQLSRTAAACGFRWNATVRKQYETHIENAKQERKQFIANKRKKADESSQPKAKTVDIAISLLEKMKEQIDTKPLTDYEEVNAKIIQLKQENERLRKMLNMYHEGWKEMNKVWDWIQKEYAEDFYSE